MLQVIKQVVDRVVRERQLHRYGADIVREFAITTAGLNPVSLVSLCFADSILASLYRTRIRHLAYISRIVLLSTALSGISYE